MAQRRAPIEWPTLALICLTYAVWALSLWLPLGVAIVGIALTGALHASLTHEVVHGHPTRWPLLNALLVFPVLTLAVPLLRFRDTHLAHHQDSRLTDPYDDPESNYLDPAQWRTLSPWRRKLWEWHNTLAGRMALGPLLGQVHFMASDLRSIAKGGWRVALGWLLHVPSVALVLWVVVQSPMPLWAYCLAVYLAIAILRIRTFLEHQAHVRARGRTVIIEDRGPLAFLFLNNNLHVVHHMHPRVAWYRLPQLYAQNSAHYLRCNEGYRYGSYGEIFRRYFWSRKDPVPHPLYEDWTAPR